MKKSTKVASFLIYVVVAVLVLLATLLSIVFFSGSLLPPMEDVIGMTTEELDATNPKILTFFMTPFGMVATLSLTVAVTLVRLVRGPFKRQEPWAREILFTMLGVLLPLALVVNLRVFPHGIWPLWALAFVAGAAAYVIAPRPDSRE